MVDVPSLAAADVLYPKNVEAIENDGIEKVKNISNRLLPPFLPL